MPENASQKDCLNYAKYHFLNTVCAFSETYIRSKTLSKKKNVSVVRETGSPLYILVGRNSRRRRTQHNFNRAIRRTMSLPCKHSCCFTAPCEPALPAQRVVEPLAKHSWSPRLRCLNRQVRMSAERRTRLVGEAEETLRTPPRSPLTPVRYCRWQTSNEAHDATAVASASHSGAATITFTIANATAEWTLATARCPLSCPLSDGTASDLLSVADNDALCMG